MRHDKRKWDEVRPITLQNQYTKYAKGSVLIAYGETKVLCTASIDDGVPPFLRDSGQGWLTAEYAMLPSATHTRNRREVNKGKPSGRTSEIQRLIGRSLRAVVDFDVLGERTIQIDADVLQADGGTRTAAITGGMVALSDAVNVLMEAGDLQQNPLTGWVSAVSVGKIKGQLMADLCYEEDSNADMDMNVVMTDAGDFIEVQGTAELAPFSRTEMDQLLDLSSTAIQSILAQVKPAYASA